MNPKKIKRQPPSLLIEDSTAAPSGQHNAIASQTKNSGESRFSRRSQYFLPALFTLVLGIAGLTLYLLPESDPSPQAKVAAPLIDSPVSALEYVNTAPTAQMQTAAEPAIASPPPAPNTSSALIVNERPATPTTPVVKKITQPTVETVAKTVSKPAVQPAQLPPRATVHTAKKPASSSDVDVLIALMRYSEDGKTSKLLDLQDRLDKCPAPNTRAGIQCRQKICAQPGGETTICPEPH